MQNRRLRKRKLTPKQRMDIIELYDSRLLTMLEISKIYEVSQPRISQIINNNYGERDALEQTYSK